MNTRKIKELMSTDLVTLDATATIHETLDLMISDRVTAIPVISVKDTCIGMISISDLLEVANESEHLMNDVGDGVFDQLWVLDRVRERLGTERIDVLMSDPVIRIDVEATVEEAATLMLHHHIHHLPVIDSNEKLVGLVSSMDLLRMLAPSYDTSAKSVL